MVTRCKAGDQWPSAVGPGDLTCEIDGLGPRVDRKKSVKVCRKAARKRIEVGIENPRSVQQCSVADPQSLIDHRFCDARVGMSDRNRCYA